MKNLRSATIASAIFLASCSSSPSNNAEPFPLKKGESRYYIKAPEVTLILGHGAIPNDTTFASQDELASQFFKSLQDGFSEQNILAQNEATADATAEIQMTYKRVFNHGGKALNKPNLSFTVTLTKDGKTLTSYSVLNKTTTYGYFKDMAVGFEIGAFLWGAEDEPKDIALIAKNIAEEVAEIGE